MYDFFFLNLVGDSLTAELVTFMKKYLFALKLRQCGHMTFLKSLLQPRIQISLNDMSAANYIPSSAEVKNVGAITPLPMCLHGIVLN
jgi:hypothetical protein